LRHSPAASTSRQVGHLAKPPPPARAMGRQYVVHVHPSGHFISVFCSRQYVVHFHPSGHFLSAYQLKNHVGDRANLKIVGRTITNRLVPLLFTYQIAREKQRKQLGSSAIADRETDAKTDAKCRNGITLLLACGKNVEISYA
jgi:hypothetical protein